VSLGLIGGDEDRAKGDPSIRVWWARTRRTTRTVSLLDPGSRRPVPTAREARARCSEPGSRRHSPGGMRRSEQGPPQPTRAPPCRRSVARAKLTERAKQRQARRRRTVTPRGSRSTTPMSGHYPSGWRHRQVETIADVAAVGHQCALQRLRPARRLDDRAGVPPPGTIRLSPHAVVPCQPRPGRA
jgi:hypothetical protein